MESLCLILNRTLHILPLSSKNKHEKYVSLFFLTQRKAPCREPRTADQLRESAENQCARFRHLIQILQQFNLEPVLRQEIRPSAAYPDSADASDLPAYMILYNFSIIPKNP